MKLPPDVERVVVVPASWPIIRAVYAIAHRDTVTIDYTNWRGERSTRRIQPRGLTYESTEHHPEAQWILHALCLEREDVRSFAVAGIHAWLPHAASEQK